MYINLFKSLKNVANIVLLCPTVPLWPLANCA